MLTASRRHVHPRSWNLATTTILKRRESRSTSWFYTKRFPAPESHWDSAENRRAFLWFVSEQVCQRKSPTKSYHDLYEISARAIIAAGGSSLLSRYNEHLHLLVMTEFPEHAWIPWKFTPRSMWWAHLGQLVSYHDEVAKAVVRNYLDNIATELNLGSLNEWQQILHNETLLPVTERNRLLQLGSLQNLLSTVYPHHSWVLPNASTGHNTGTPTPRLTLPPGFSDSPKNRFEFIAQICKLSQKNYEDYNKLYSLTTSDFRRTGGTAILAKYGDSVALAIMAEFPDHSWKQWKFAAPPRDFWEQTMKHGLSSYNPEVAEACLREYIEDVGRSLGVESLDEWCKIPLSRLDHGVFKRLTKLGGLLSVLKRLYPTHQWNISIGKTSKKASQQQLLKARSLRLLPRNSTENT